MAIFGKYEDIKNQINNPKFEKAFSYIQKLQDKSSKEYKNLENHILECEYSFLGQLEYILNQNSIKIVDKEFQNSVKTTISLAKDEFETLKSLLPREIKII